MRVESLQNNIKLLIVDRSFSSIGDVILQFIKDGNRIWCHITQTCQSCVYIWEQELIKTILRLKGIKSNVMGQIWRSHTRHSICKVRCINERIRHLIIISMQKLHKLHENLRPKSPQWRSICIDKSERRWWWFLWNK